MRLAALIAMLSLIAILMVPFAVAYGQTIRCETQCYPWGVCETTCR